MMALARAVGRNELNRIESICGETLRRNPRDFFALMMPADAYWRGEQPDRALSYALRALDVEPESFNALCIVADVYAQRGEHERAYLYAKLIITADPPRLPPTKLLSDLLKPFGWLPRIRRIRQRVGREDDSNLKWLAWARDYVSWYEAQRHQDPQTVRPRWLH